MLSFDAAQTKVILIGTSLYPNDETLPYLPSVDNNLDRLYSIFSNKNLIGIPEKNIEVIRNVESSVKLLTRVRMIANSAADTLIVYYAGHGIKAPLGKGLYLASKETTQDNCYIDGVEFEKLRRLISESNASKRILILDCCFSGEATSGEMGGSTSLVSAGIEIRGTYSIASAPANRLSIAEIGQKYTSFTGHLIEVLSKGVASKDSFLSLDEIYYELKRRIRSDPKLPEPQRRSELDIDNFLLSRNAANMLVNIPEQPDQKDRSNNSSITRMTLETDESISSIRYAGMVSNFLNVDKYVKYLGLIMGVVSASLCCLLIASDVEVFNLNLFFREPGNKSIFDIIHGIIFGIFCSVLLVRLNINSLSKLFVCLAGCVVVWIISINLATLIAMQYAKSANADVGIIGGIAIAGMSGSILVMFLCKFITQKELSASEISVCACLGLIAGPSYYGIISNAPVGCFIFWQSSTLFQVGRAFGKDGKSSLKRRTV